MNAQLLAFPDHDSVRALSFEERVQLLVETIAGSGRPNDAVTPYMRALCALVCAFDRDSNASHVIEALPRDDTFGFESFLNAFAHLGFDLHDMPLTPSDLDTRLLPCLFLAKGERPYVLLERREDGIYAFDATAFAYQTVRTDRFGKGRIVTVRYVSQQERRLDTQAHQAAGRGWLRQMLGRFRPHFAQLLAVSFFINIAALSVPLLIMLVYDRVIGVHATNDLPYLAMGFGVAIILETALRFLRARHLAWLGARIDVTSTHAIIERLLHLPAAMIERASVASQIARIKGFEEIRDFFTGPLFLTLIELPFTLVLLGTLALIAGKLAFIPVAAAVLYGCIFFILRSGNRRMMFMAAKTHSQLQQTTLETFTSMETLRVSGMQQSWHTHMRDLSADASYRMFRSSFFSSVLETLAYTVTTLAGLSILYLGVQEVLAGRLTSGALIASMILVWRILSPISMLCTMLPRIEQLKQTTGQLNRLMQIAPEATHTGSDTAQTSKGPGHVLIHNVAVRYNRETNPVFAGLSFEARPGMLVGIMGGNGCGKSTLLKLVMGLYQPQVGTIRLDGTDIRQFAADDLRRNFAYVPQTPDFFTGTIAENMRIAWPQANEEQIKHALNEAGILNDVLRLPQGLHTVLDCSEQGGAPTLLSYRLNLARACLSPGRVVLCDELPYALLNDEYGEQYRSLLKRWQGARTAFFVTHREDFIALADMVIGLRRSGPPLVGAPAAVLPLMKKESYESISARAR